MEFSDFRLYNRYYEYLDCVRWFVFRACSNDEFLKDIKIEKPFTKMERLVLDEDSTELHKAMFSNWCRYYERTLYGVFEMWREVVGVVDEGDCWKLVFSREKRT